MLRPGGLSIVRGGSGDCRGPGSLSVASACLASTGGPSSTRRMGPYGSSKPAIPQWNLVPFEMLNRDGRVGTSSHLGPGTRAHWQAGSIAATGCRHGPGASESAAAAQGPGPGPVEGRNRVAAGRRARPPPAGPSAARTSGLGERRRVSGRSSREPRGSSESQAGPVWRGGADGPEEAVDHARVVQEQPDRGRRRERLLGHGGSGRGGHHRLAAPGPASAAAPGPSSAAGGRWAGP